MCFLIEIKFRKGSKIGTILPKIEEDWNFRHLCCRLDKLLPTFSHNLRFEYQRSGQWKFYCTKMFVVSMKIGINL